MSDPRLSPQLIIKALSEQEPWVSDLTPQLVTHADNELLRPRRLSLAAYTTERFVAKNPDLVSDVQYTITLGERRLVIEELTELTKRNYENLGLRFACLTGENTSTILRAFELLHLLPALHNSVTALIRVIHILDSRSPHYDVSHSDPALPFSVFVSIPDHTDEFSAIRLVESLVHEAMHLQLTIIENLLELYETSDAVLYSPWREELRPPSGMLHGIYVFASIVTAYRRLRSVEMGERMQIYMNKRLAEISKELRIAFFMADRAFFTEIGATFLEILHRQIGWTTDT